MHVREDDVEVTTPDGVADAVLFRPEGGTHPGVLFLPDGIGLRASQREMARRVAEQGFVVLLPNIYYRTGRPPFFDGRPDFADEATKVRFGQLTGSLTPEAMVRDGSAFVDFLAGQAETSDAPIGVVGFCFTGRFALRIAAARADRIGAAASFHGGGLYTEDANSPHRVLPQVRSRLYFGHAKDDRSMPAEAIAKLEDALAQWGGRYESETYDARHGWTVPDSAAYDEREAERAFAKLMEVFRS
jgi:carboxymethylenebutenolidase